MGVAVPLPSGLLHQYDFDYEIYNIVAQPCYCYSKQSHRTPHLRIYRLKRRCFVTSYAQSVMQQYESKTVKKNFCDQSSHCENYGRLNGSHNVLTTKSTLFVVNKDEW